VGAVDGVHFAMQAPSNSDAWVTWPATTSAARTSTPSPAVRRCVRCGAPLHVQTYYDISQVPTTHDSLAWSMSTLGQRINNGELPAPFFINGDAAFCQSPSMICPSALPEHDDFDWHQSSNRTNERRKSTGERHSSTQKCNGGRVQGVTEAVGRADACG
jgi:hypothetical protein